MWFVKAIRGTAAFWTIVIAVGITPDAAVARASFEILPFVQQESLGEDRLALSADGRTVVGLQRDALGVRDWRGVPARWDAGSGPTRLTFTEDERYEIPLGISADGSTIVGRFLNEAGTARVASLIRDGGAPIPIVSDADSGLTDASADGRVVVGGRGRGPGLSGEGGRGFVWDELNGVRDLSALTGVTDVMTALAVSNDGRVVVGSTWPEIGYLGARGYSWSEETGYVQLPLVDRGTQSLALAISGDGSTIVGTTRVGTSPIPSFNRQTATRWTEEGAILLPRGDYEIELTSGETRPGGTVFARFANSVSGDGSVIVGQAQFLTETGSTEGFGSFIYFGDTDETRSLKRVLQERGASDVNDWMLETATNISDDGRVVTGWARWNDLSGPLPEELRQMGVEFFAFRAVIPEPSTALLLGLGLAAMSRRARN